MLENLLILPLALVIDLLIGEYPAPLHPVAWTGHVISFFLKSAPRKGKALQVVCGVSIVIFTAALFTVPVFFLLAFLIDHSPAAYVIVGALLLKSAFSVRTLYRMANEVKRLLEAGKLDEARKQTGFLVSRDTKKLSRGEVASAIIEMTAESVTDSVAAPLFYWMFFGVPGAVFYRVVNTFDSRIGYHGEYEYLGKFAAVLDDILNYVPARIAALILVTSAYVLRKDGRQAWRTVLHDHGKTASPNAGWTMSAAAGALGVRLEKPGHYRLGRAGEYPDTPAITSGLRLVLLSSFICFGICTGIAGVFYALAA
jgi:adenosylcobinamide-phosphate synthase